MTVKQKLYGTVIDAPLSIKLGRDDRREAILSIAHAAFLADGYAATSMSTIATRLGGSKGTLYNYFSSKEELFGAVISNKCEQLLSHLYDADMQSGDFRSALQSFGERFLQLMLQEESIATYRLIMAECGRFPELGKTFYDAAVKQGHNRLGEYFRQAIAVGELRDCSPIVMAQYFFDLCLCGVHLRNLWNVEASPSAERIRFNVQRAISIFLAAFGGEKIEHPDPVALCK